MAADVAIGALAVIGACSVLAALVFGFAGWRHIAIARRVDARMAEAPERQRDAEVRIRFAEMVAAERARTGWEARA